MVLLLFNIINVWKFIAIDLSCCGDGIALQLGKKNVYIYIYTATRAFGIH